MGQLMRRLFENLPKYQVNLTFAITHTKIHLQHRMGLPPSQRTNSLLAWFGHTGIGKSSNAKRLARIFGVRYCRWDARAQLFEDNLGIPDPAGKTVTNADGTTKKVTVNMEAALLPIFEDEPILLEIGELPTASQDVLNQIREIIDGIFTNRPVSPTCMMVATGNPLTEEYTTVTADLCQSIEDRVHPYVIVPDEKELLSIWSTMMDPIVYQFLLGHRQFIKDLSPRGWMDIATSVQALANAGMDAGAIIKDIRPRILDTLSAPLLSYIQAGYQPDKVPILGREFLGGSPEQFEVYMRRLQGWFDRNERGFIGASKIDLARVLMRSEDEFQKKYPEAGARYTTLMELYLKNGAHDIASSLLDALYNSDKALVSKPIMAVFGRSDAVTEMSKKFSEFTKKYEKVLEQVA